MEQIIVYLTNVFQEYLIIILLLCFSLIAFFWKKLRCPKCKKFSLKEIPLEELKFYRSDFYVRKCSKCDFIFQKEKKKSDVNEPTDHPPDL
tara:strand:+ start:269 stop:541 length:273 start_codon:yes stop_codon:yes gene_type:complete